jgi:hypothetical protein
MIKFKCLVNGGIAPAVRTRVVAGLQAIYRERFSLEPQDM